MAREIGIGVSGQLRKITEGYVGVNGALRRITEGYVGVNGVPRLFYAAAKPYYYGYDITVATADPAARVTYPADVDNAKFTPAKMDFASGKFSYGGWALKPGEAFMPRPCMLRFDGTVGYYLDPDNYGLREDGSPSDVANVNYGGNAMMEWPKIYTKRWEENGVYHFRCANYKPDDGYECWCNYDIHNNEIDHFYTPIYFGSKDSAGRLRSISGQSNFVNASAQDEIDAAKLNGAEDWFTEVVADRFLIQDLLVLVYKSTDLQAAAGNGVCGASAAILPGSMDTKGMFWGSNSQTSGVKVFGMENWWGNIWRRTAGWIAKNGKQWVKVTRGNKDGTAAADYNIYGSGYLDTGTTVTYLGYISKMKAKPYGRIPSEISGSGSTYEADYDYSVSSNGPYYACLGGRWSSGQYVGPFCADLDYAPSASTTIGAALSCKPVKKE